MITLEFLRSLDVFKGTPEAEIVHLLPRIADARVRMGEYLVREGDTPTFIIVLQGLLEITKALGPTERVIATRAAGDFFGELSLMLGCPSFAGLRATGDGRALRIEAVDFKALLKASPALKQRVRLRLHDRVEAMFEFSEAAPTAAVVIAGDRFDAATHEIRDFLARHQIAFEFVEPTDPTLLDVLPEAAGLIQKSPLVKVCDGSLLFSPSLRDLARRLGLQPQPHQLEYDVAIVGSGAAAIAAATYAASEGLRTLMIEREAPDSELSIECDDIGSGRSPQQAFCAGAEILTTRDVTAIRPGHEMHEIELDGGDAVRTRSILLATGVRWRMLPIPEIDRFVGAGVYFGNAARTESSGAQGKEIYLVGASESAARAVAFFAAYAARVTLVTRESALTALSNTQHLHELCAKGNVHFELDSEIVGVHGNGRLQNVDIANCKTGETTRRPAEALFVFAGGDPRTDWLPEQIARDERGYVLTGFHMLFKTPELWPAHREPFFLETSVPGIFATGDVRARSVKRIAAEIGESSMAVAFIHEYLRDLQAISRETPAEPSDRPTDLALSLR